MHSKEVVVIKSSATDEKESLREKERTDLIENATTSPGIREAMKVSQNWREIDLNLDAYRLTTRKSSRGSTKSYRKS